METYYFLIYYTLHSSTSSHFYYPGHQKLLCIITVFLCSHSHVHLCVTSLMHSFILFALKLLSKLLSKTGQ